MLTVADTKDVVELLKSKVLGLREEEVAEYKTKNIPGAIPAESACIAKTSSQSGPGETDDEVEAPRDGSTRGHADVTDMKRERFCAVGEGHGSETGGIDSHEEVKTCGDAGNTRFSVRLGNVEHSTCEEETSSHKWKGYQEQVSSTKGINGVDSRNGEQEVDDTTAHRNQESFRQRVTTIFKDRGRIISDYIYATKLLHELRLDVSLANHVAFGATHHAKPGTLGSTSVAANGEELLQQVSAFTLTTLNLEKLVSVVHIPGSLNRGEPQFSD